MHRYRAQCSWTGSTAGGIAAYDRGHQASAPPAASTLRLSADPAFRGDPDLLNPEQLLVLAAASCQLLSFLAVAARAGVDVVRYDDQAEGVLLPGQRTSITEITLRPRIQVAPGTSEQRVCELVEQAHEECFIANSLRSAVTVIPGVSYPDSVG